MDLSSEFGAFNSKTAIWLAAMSYQTYPLYSEGKVVLPKGFELVYTIRAFADAENPTELVFGFIAESKNRIVVAFRGYAAYPADLLAAYDILQVPYSFVKAGGKTSRGFTCLYQSTRNNFFKELNKLPATKKLFITGHNYGGALAELAALDIAVNTGFKHPFVYTYGSPRVGDHDFASRFDQVVKNSFRIVNIHDSYPTFPARVYPPPFTKEGLVYRHVNTKYPVAFQLNNTTRNNEIGCYFKSLSKQNLRFSKELCSKNPGFCPDTAKCFPF
ncbi:lipase family protein [Paenibacillus sp. N4]|uniref:lipase family protein n=1 Tax=Paenibacillus vietnamensis TaxID=2590547 RepID=UPI001CD048EF|nr:lipase family protein [Paenibacillus vietnamensis]MCA0756632.1 lipase family protein [Paenibacillus vietnamensis]